MAPNCGVAGVRNESIMPYRIHLAIAALFTLGMLMVEPGTGACAQVTELFGNQGPFPDRADLSSRQQRRSLEHMQSFGRCMASFTRTSRNCTCRSAWPLQNHWSLPNKGFAQHWRTNVLRQETKNDSLAACAAA